MQQFCYSSGQKCYPGASLTDKDDISFFNFNIFRIGLLHQPLVVIVHCNCNDFLSHILTNDILVEKILDLGGFKKVNSIKRYILFAAKFLVHYAVSLLNAMVTDMTLKPSNKHIGL